MGYPKVIGIQYNTIVFQDKLYDFLNCLKKILFKKLYLKKLY